MFSGNIDASLSRAEKYAAFSRGKAPLSHSQVCVLSYEAGGLNEIHPCYFEKPDGQ